MATLPPEIIVDILLRLPVKALLRFRCASKPWCALIDGPNFIKMHLNRSIEHNAHHSLILIGWYLYSVDMDTLDEAVQLDHPLKNEEFGTEVLGSCNGLLCLAVGIYDIVLWNPSTRKLRTVPFALMEFMMDSFTISQFPMYGFGYDYARDDYKLVRMVQLCGEDDDSFDSHVKVYSLKTNSWKRVRDCPFCFRYEGICGNNGMLACGALHWLGFRRLVSDTTELIVAFDIALEDYREVLQPEYLDENFQMSLGVLGGCLCVICNYHGVRVDIWVMKEYGVKESWNKLFSVSQPEASLSFEQLRPLAYSRSGREVLLEQNNKKIIWYDLEKKRVRDVQIHGSPRSIKAEICFGSLVPLNGDGRIDGKKQQAQEKKKKRDDFLSVGFKLVL
ncbi:hypothetical protein L1049_010548 [Liquidambar formosana]|uniref:F-box domain-containing protein n=1 Tax=Liquidambar formosana TaxID=63359 RepID=A0AAP0R4Y9_LIQFO